MTPSRCGVNRRFGGTYRSLAPALTIYSLADFLIFAPTLKMEAIRSSETSLNTTSTRHHIPQDCFLHSHRRENLKPLNYDKFLKYVYIKNEKGPRHSSSG
jgi:hypothetical protein